MASRALLVGSLVGFATLGSGARAHADGVKLTGSVLGGGMYGSGTAGDAQGEAFFHESPHGAYGVEVGVEVLFLRGAIGHHQFTDGSRITTWTQFELGTNFQIDFAAAAVKTDDGEKKPKAEKKHEGTYAEIGFGLLAGLGTGQLVEPPLDNSEITDKAVLVGAHVGIGKHLNDLLDVGVQLPVSYGYFIKNGPELVANDLDNHYQAFQGELLVYLRVNARLF